MSIPNCAYRMRSLLAATLLITASHMAGAVEPDQIVPESFTFRFARADLATASGVEKVYAQLTREARRACNVFGAGTELWRARLRSDCHADLVDKVVAKVGARALAARHEGTAYFRQARR